MRMVAPNQGRGKIQWSVGDRQGQLGTEQELLRAKSQPESEKLQFYLS